MPKLISALPLITALLLIGANSYGQKVMVEVSGFDFGQKYPYVGVNNRLKVVVEGKMCEELIVTTNNGTIEPFSINSCKYLFRPIRLDTATIYFATSHGKDTVVFKEIKLKTSTLPFKLCVSTTHADLRTVCTYSISKQDFLDKKPWTLPFKINDSATFKGISLEIKVNRNDTQIFKKSITEYTPESEKQLKKGLVFLKSGDIVLLRKLYLEYFEDADWPMDIIELIIE